ncbi:hypothetical protein ABPG74_001925 [Tetrahymena malaccensis]
MRNRLLLLLACLVLSINADGFNLTVDQINNKIVQPREDSNCKGSFCFVGDTLLTVQSDDKRIISITLTNSNPKSYGKLVIKSCPTSNVLSITDSDMLRLYVESKNQCYSFSNYRVMNKSRGWYFFVINALLADQETYQQFNLDVNLEDPAGKPGSSSSSYSLFQQVGMLILALSLLL